MSLVLVNVTGSWQGYDGNPADGSVTFTPYGWRSVPTTDLTLAPRAESATMTGGTVSQPLTAPTSADDDEVRYSVEVTIQSGGVPVTDRYDIVMPAVAGAGLAMDLADRDLDTGLLVVGDGPGVPVDPGDGSGDPCADCVSE